jgi:hypothetical protein
VTAVASAVAVSSMSCASWLPTAADASLSKPNDDTVAAGSVDVHLPATLGKMSFRVLTISPRVSRRSIGEPSAGV